MHAKNDEKHRRSVKSLAERKLRSDQLNYGVLLQPPVRHVPEEPQRRPQPALLGVAVGRRLVLVELPSPAAERGSVPRRVRWAAAVGLLSASRVPPVEPRLGRPRELRGAATERFAAAGPGLGARQPQRPVPVDQPGDAEPQRAHQRRTAEPAIAAHHRVRQRHEQSGSAQRIVVSAAALAPNARQEPLRVDEEAVISKSAQSR